jgi:predicted dehydrogenase
MMVAFRYDTGAVGALYYSREIPSLLRGLRVSKLFGREGVITFESNGVFIVARGPGLPRVILPGFRDIRGYQAMYRDFAAAIREGRAPEMNLDRAMEDQRLMETVYLSDGDGEAGNGNWEGERGDGQRDVENGKQAAGSGADHGARARDRRSR